MTFLTTAAKGSAAGDYEIMPAGLTASNYDIIFRPGLLHITALPVAEAQNAPYQAALSYALNNITVTAAAGRQSTVLSLSTNAVNESNTDNKAANN